MPALRCRSRLARFLFVPLLAIVSSPACLSAEPGRAFRVDVLVDNQPLTQYDANRLRYVEALKGREFSIRLHNPLGERVAVALSVDGLNTIDARHTTPREARKWVLGPYETVTISGWQTSMRQARRFYFTTEERSYASRLGQPQDLGIISAVFFRERSARVLPLGSLERQDGDPGRNEADARGKAGKARPDAAAAPSAVGQPGGTVSRPAEDYAATGIGDRVDHPVQTVHFDLEERPAAAVDIRYEYRAQLVRLGILPGGRGDDPLARRERARGFEGAFCPDLK